MRNGKAARRVIPHPYRTRQEERYVVLYLRAHLAVPGFQLTPFICYLIYLSRAPRPVPHLRRLGSCYACPGNFIKINEQDLAWPSIAKAARPSTRQIRAPSICAAPGEEDAKARGSRRATSHIRPER